MTVDPKFDIRIVTCGGTPHRIVTPMTKKGIRDAAHISVRVHWTPRHVRRTCRDGSNPGDTFIAVNFSLG